MRTGEQREGREQRGGRSGIFAAHKNRDGDSDLDNANGRRA